MVFLQNFRTDFHIFLESLNKKNKNLIRKIKKIKIKILLKNSLTGIGRYYLKGTVPILPNSHVSFVQ